VSSREQERKALRLIPYPSPAARSMISCGDVQRRIACCRSERLLQAATQERRALKSASEREEGEKAAANRIYTFTLQRDQEHLVHHRRKRVVNRRIRYWLGNMNTASLVGSGRFFRQHSAGLSAATDHLAGWSNRSTIEFVENNLLRRNHGATGGLDGRGGRWP